VDEAGYVWDIISNKKEADFLFHVRYEFCRNASRFTRG